MRLRFHNAMLEPEDAERAGLNAAYRDWIEAREGDSNDSEHATAADLIEALMGFAGIDVDDDSDDSEEDHESGPENPCSQCGQDIGDDVHAGHGMCASCLHDAVRSGWEPGAES